MKRVLLPTDFSDNAFNAVQYAVQFFKNEETQFYLLNTFTPMAYHAGYLIENPSPYGLEDIALMNSKRNLEEIEEKIQKKFPNPKHSFTRLSVFNTLVSEIKDIVESQKIDLIVMGTKGATGAKEIFLGTHTMYTIKKVKCPVIAVPEKFEYETPKEILFPTDYNVHHTNKYLKLIREVAKDHDAQINILNAYFGVPLDEDQIETKKFLDGYFKNLSRIFHISKGMDVQEAIEDFQKHHKINLLVMIHNKHTFFENLLFKPVIKQIVFHCNVPFLVIPSEERMH